MRRAFWFAAGAASGVYTLFKAKRTAQNFTPDGIAARIASLGAGARAFADEVSVGMADREQELRAQLHTPSTPARAPRMIEDKPAQQTPDQRGHEDLADGHS